MSLQTKIGRAVRHQRPDPDWVGKIISRIGNAAGIAVRADAGRGESKYASAHDLRRSCAARLGAAGVREREVNRVIRHAGVQTTRRHYAPGTVHESAGIIRQRLYLGSSKRQKCRKSSNPQRIRTNCEIVGENLGSVEITCRILCTFDQFRLWTGGSRSRLADATRGRSGGHPGACARLVWVANVIGH